MNYVGNLSIREQAEAPKIVCPQTGFKLCVRDIQFSDFG